MKHVLRRNIIYEERLEEFYGFTKYPEAKLHASEYLN